MPRARKSDLVGTTKTAPLLSQRDVYDSLYLAGRIYYFEFWEGLTEAQFVPVAEALRAQFDYVRDVKLNLVRCRLEICVIDSGSMASIIYPIDGQVRDELAKAIAQHLREEV